MRFENACFITDTAYAGKSTMVKLPAEKYDGILCEENYCQGLLRINSQARYDRFLHAGFQVILRDENRSIEETLALAEQAFGLCGKDKEYDH